MKRLKYIILFSLLAPLPLLAQPKFYGGLNLAESTNIGFLGLNPSVEIVKELSPHWGINITTNGFLSFARVEGKSGSKKKEYHRSFFLDLGFSRKIIVRKVSWSLGTGTSYRVGKERYLSGFTIVDGQQMETQFDNVNLSSLGFYLKNSIGFSRGLREFLKLNITIYHHGFTGEYVGIGPSFLF